MLLFFFWCCLELNRFIYSLKWSHYFACCFYLRFCLAQNAWNFRFYSNSKWFVIKIIYWFTHFEGSLLFLSPFIAILTATLLTYTVDSKIIASSALFVWHLNYHRIDWTGAVIINFDIFTDKSARAMIFTPMGKAICEKGERSIQTISIIILEISTNYKENFDLMQFKEYVFLFGKWNATGISFLERYICMSWVYV